MQLKILNNKCETVLTLELDFLQSKLWPVLKANSLNSGDVKEHVVVKITQAGTDGNNNCNCKHHG